MATCKPRVNQFVSKPNQSPGIGTQVMVSILHFIDLFVIIFIFFIIDNREKEKIFVFSNNISTEQFDVPNENVYTNSIFIQFAI